MKPGIPWSVKGIGAEAREAAKHAARRSGMTLGEWLNTVILEQADQPDLEVQSPGPLLQRSRSASDTAIRLEDLAQQLARLTQREQDTAAGTHYEQHAAAPIDSAAFDRIVSRVDLHERQTVDAFAALNERLNSISQHLDDSQRVWQPQRPEDVPGFQALEGALRNIVEHIEVSERRTRDHLKSMQDRLSDLSQKAVSSDDPRLAVNASAISGLESRVAEMAGRLDRTELAARQELPPAVENHLNRLSERIEAVRQSSEMAIQRAQTVAAQAARAELEEVEARIQAFLKEAQASFDASLGAGDGLKRLHDEIESLNQRIDDLRADSASERDLHALRQAIEQLSARIAQGPDLRPLGDVEQRLADLAQRFEQSQDFSGLGIQLGDIDSRIQELDQRLGNLVQSGQDGDGLRNLEQHLTGLSDRLAAAEKQFANITNIERSITQLFDSLEQSRNWTREVAEDTFNRMADRLISASPALQTQPAAGPSPELQALESGLAAVRASAEASDQRTQETLVALHETLEQIVNKLTELEATPPAVTQPLPPTSEAAAEVEAQGLPETPDLPDLPNLQPPPRRTASDADIFGVPHKFEAGAVPQAEPVEDQRTTPAPAATPAAEAGLAAASPEAIFEDPLSPADDFIAAARRAAQVAAQQSAAAAANAAAVEKLGRQALQDSRRFKFLDKFTRPFQRTAQEGDRAMPGQPHPILPAPGSEGSLLAARRVPLIVAGLVLLAAVTAITFKQLAGGPAEAPQTQSRMDFEARPPVSVKAAMLQPVSEAATQATEAAAEGEGKQDPSDSLSGEGGSEVVGQAAESRSNVVADEILTASLPVGKLDADLQSIVVESGTVVAKSAAVDEMPGEEIRPESLRFAASQGNATAQFIIASRYLDGQSVAQDFSAAARWYEKAAAQGLAPAQYRLATLFERGRGVPLDMATARLWYERAAENGNVRAMHNVAVIYASAQSGAPDYARAARWFSAAAEHGLKDSQFNLAVLLERGLGRKKSLADALFWYMAAAAQDDADAKVRTAAVEALLPAATVSDVKARLAKWKPKAPQQDANVVAVSDKSWQVPAELPAEPANTSEKIQDAPSIQQGASVLPESTVDPVERVQKLLVSHGFDIGQADGRLGSRTVNAIRMFEMKAGMRVTGKITQELIHKLEAAPNVPPA
jgi:localization factor PodJL